MGLGRAPVVDGRAEGLRARAVQGAFWNIALAVGNKALTTAGQLVLAWYLFPNDMGVVAMAASVVAVATFFTASGIDDLLVQRHATYAEDAPQVFWLSLGFNGLAVAVVAILAPLASSYFGDPRVAGLMLIQAAGWPIASVTLVLRPKLANGLRFKAMAWIRFGEGAVFTGTAVLLAMRHFGAYALAWPVFSSALFSALAYWAVAGGPPLGRPKPAAWGRILSPALLLMVGNFVATMAVQLPNFIVASRLDARATGLYAWGALAASQAVFLLALNLRGLFTPLFAKLQAEPGRLAEAVAKSAFAITALLAPVCVLQAFLAGPAIRIFFPDRWLGAVGVVFWLSLGFCAQPLSLVAQSALIAKARFGFALKLALAQAVLGAAGVAWGCLHGGIAAAAMGAAVGAFLGLPLNLWVLRRQLACPWALLAKTPAALLLGAAAFLPSYFLSASLAGSSPAWADALPALLYLALVFALVRLLAPDLLSDLRSLRNLAALKGELDRAAPPASSSPL